LVELLPQHYGGVLKNFIRGRMILHQSVHEPVEPSLMGDQEAGKVFGFVMAGHGR